MFAFGEVGGCSGGFVVQAFIAYWLSERYNASAGTLGLIFFGIAILQTGSFLVAPRPEGWSIEVPTFRVDVTREADLIEEVGRHYGYDRLPTTFPVKVALDSRPPDLPLLNLNHLHAGQTRRRSRDERSDQITRRVVTDRDLNLQL